MLSPKFRYRECFNITFIFVFLIFGCAKVPPIYNEGVIEKKDSPAKIYAKDYSDNYIQKIFDVEREVIVYEQEKQAYRMKKFAFLLEEGLYEITFGIFPHEGNVEFTEIIYLQNSHTYEVKSKWCFEGGGGLLKDSILTILIPTHVYWLWDPVCDNRSYEGTVWIEDVTTGEVIAGEKWTEGRTK